VLLVERPAQPQAAPDGSGLQQTQLLHNR
jgi:hypothetical protein